MRPFYKVSWKTCVSFLLISVICVQIYLAIITHQSTPNTLLLQTHTQSNQNRVDEIDATSIIDLHPGASPRVLERRKRHINNHRDHVRSKQNREMRMGHRGLHRRRFNHSFQTDGIGSIGRHRYRKKFMRMNLEDIPEDMIELHSELQHLINEKEEGGWLDINKISSNSSLIALRDKNMNITHILTDDTTVNRMTKYDFKNDTIINNRWNKNDIDSLLKDKHALYTKYHILQYESNMNYDLQQLEYDILQWIITHQHPKQCPERFFQIYVLDQCGFACKLDGHILMNAKFALKNGLLFEFQDWGQNMSHTLHEYGTWNAFFRPLSNVLKVCTEEQLKRMKPLVSKPFEIGYWVPELFEDRIEALHSDPVLYFHGVLNRYLLRLNEEYAKEYLDLKDELWNKMKKNRKKEIVIGCHVRRTDKIIESNVYAWDNYLDLIQYMVQYNDVDDYGKHLLLATDDKDIVQSAIVDNDNHGVIDHVLWNKYAMDIDSEEGRIELKQRRTEHALRSIVFDVLLLSECDLFIGQDGSRVSRLVLELMAMRLPDYKQRLISLDAVNNNVLDFPYWIAAIYIYSIDEMMVGKAFGRFGWAKGDRLPRRRKHPFKFTPQVPNSPLKKNRKSK